jgi:hypothetical protein
MDPRGAIPFSDHHHGEGAELFKRACAKGKPIAYLGRDADGQLQFAGTAFLTLAGKARRELQERMEKLTTNRPPVKQRTWRKPPSVLGLTQEEPVNVGNYPQGIRDC